jgi:hypothetical protein
VADPPWRLDGIPYPAQSVAEIAATPLLDLVAEDAIVWPVDCSHPTSSGSSKPLGRDMSPSNVEFKEQFDTGDDGGWLELTKDFAAIANIGGGVIVVGVQK